MPPNTVKVTRPGKWGNPFKVGVHCETSGAAVAMFKKHLDYTPIPDISLLRGKNLACWCKIGTLCHADVLLELANSP